MTKWRRPARLLSEHFANDTHNLNGPGNSLRRTFHQDASLHEPSTKNPSHTNHYLSIRRCRFVTFRTFKGNLTQAVRWRWQRTWRPKRTSLWRFCQGLSNEMFCETSLCERTCDMMQFPNRFPFLYFVDKGSSSIYFGIWLDFETWGGRGFSKNRSRVQYTGFWSSWPILFSYLL